MPSEGWAIELVGERFDLDDLRDQLKLPFDPWVEDYQIDGASTLLLRSCTWERLIAPRDVMADANRLIAYINAAAALHISDSRRVTLGTTMRFRGDGSRVPIAIVGTMNITLEGCRVRGRGIALGAPPPEPAPSSIQMWIEKAGKDERVADVLLFLDRADNWFDLYKAIETVQSIYPGGSRLLDELYPAWEIVRRVANRARHAPVSWRPLPKDPPSLEEAKKIIFDILKAVL